MPRSCDSPNSRLFLVSISCALFSGALVNPGSTLVSALALRSSAEVCTSSPQTKRKSSPQSGRRWDGDGTTLAKPRVALPPSTFGFFLLALDFQWAKPHGEMA